MARTQGLDRLRRRLAAIPKRARTEIRAALEKSAQEISSAARTMVPVESGDLKRSIAYTFGKYIPDNANVRGVAAGGSGDPDLSVTIHAGDERAYYAAFVEFGTNPHPQGGTFKGTSHPGGPAEPFFFPAYRMLKARVKNRIARATRKAARDAAKG